MFTFIDLQDQLLERCDGNAIIEFMETNAEGISYNSKQNLAANRRYGLNLSATTQLTERWSANSNINLNYFDYSSDALAIFRSGWGAATQSLQTHARVGIWPVAETAYIS